MVWVFINIIWHTIQDTLRNIKDYIRKDSTNCSNRNDANVGKLIKIILIPQKMNIKYKKGLSYGQNYGQKQEIEKIISDI